MMDDVRVEERVGLCATCVHARVVPSAKQQTYYRCDLSDVDPRFPRYPQLPVVRCAGFERARET
jgi:hypothetical protein